MTVELGGIKLNRVHRLVTLEQADWVSHQIPGMEGNVVQDLGRDLVKLEISGICYGAETASQELETLRQVYKKREPVDFLAEIVGQAYFSRVIIHNFQVFQLAEEPEQFSYTIAIREYVTNSKTQAKTNQNIAKVNQSIKLQAQTAISIASLPDALQLGTLPEITNPIEPLKGALEPIKEATQGLDEVTKGLKAILGIESFK